MQQDFDIYNESNMITLHSSTYNGVPRSELFEKGEAVQEAGHLIMIGLPGDDVVCLRLVIDESLIPAEETEWVSMMQWHLYLPDGKPGLEGGLDARFTDQEAMEWDYLTYTDVPHMKNQSADGSRTY